MFVIWYSLVIKINKQHPNCGQTSTHFSLQETASAWLIKPIQPGSPRSTPCISYSETGKLFLYTTSLLSNLFKISATNDVQYYLSFSLIQSKKNLNAC